MSNQFSKHYTLCEARDLLPMVKVWLDRLFEIQLQLVETEPKLEELLKQGRDIGGSEVNLCVRLRLEFTDILEEFQEADVQIKDLEKGLIDFPAWMEGREVFLCWHKGEEDIGFWHEIDEGFEGRQKISPDFF